MGAVTALPPISTPLGKNDTMSDTKPQRRFTGYHMTAILVSFFAVVIAVNLYMAHMASATYGGEVVKNSYVASQKFNGWLDEAAREKAMGWTASAARTPANLVSVTIKGAPGSSVALTAQARHPLGRLADQKLSFTRQRDGSFLSKEALPAGRWRLRLDAEFDGKRWREEMDIQ